MSGNRNFEGRVNPLVKANYLASPPLVVAYALAGTVDIDLASEPLGTDSHGQAVFLRDIWPAAEEIHQAEAKRACCRKCSPSGMPKPSSRTRNGMRSRSTDADLYAWDPHSTYIQEPPFLVDLTAEVRPIQPIRGARVLAVLGDSVTTDHISPAGSIAKDSPGRQVPDRPRCRPDGFQQLRIATWQ